MLLETVEQVCETLYWDWGIPYTYRDPAWLCNAASANCRLRLITTYHHFIFAFLVPTSLPRCGYIMRPDREVLESASRASPADLVVLLFKKEIPYTY